MENQEEFLDRKKQKEKVHPYRKYQILIILLVIAFIILGSVVYSLNKTLNIHLTENKSLIIRHNKVNQSIGFLDELYQMVRVNFEKLYEMEKEPLIQIIHNIDELEMIKRFIKANGTINYSLCYKATVYGYSPEIFNRNCLGQSPLVFMIETTEGYRFGAYTNVPFLQEDKGYKDDPEAFLFSFDLKKKFPVIKSSTATYFLGNRFPMFGDRDIYISENFLNNSMSFTKFPTSYEIDEETSRAGTFILNGGVKNFKIKELEVLVAFVFES